MLPDWLSPEQFDTVIVAFPDAYGRLMGKRLTLPHFVEHVADHGWHACNYLLTVDLAMNPMDGFRIAGWDQGYGDFTATVDPATLRPLPWSPGTALALSDLRHEDGRLVEEAPRRVLARQVERLAERGWRALIGSELEFFLFAETYRDLAAAGYRQPVRSADYLIDYHLLAPGRDEAVLRRLRQEMTGARVDTECSKGEWGLGQHEVNLACTDPLEMADRQVVFKLGAKEIAGQEGRSITFMAKWSADEAGNSCHIHSSLWQDERPLFVDADGPSRLFRAFLGGLLRYGRELCYFFAPTVNAYKRYQAASWAPTKLVWSHDNRTCGFRILGRDAAFRIENRMPGGDANPYLAFAATIAAGLRGIDDGLDAGEPYLGNAYLDDSLPSLPQTLDAAAALLDESVFARETFGDDVIDYYVRTAQIECDSYRSAVTDWERTRYFEQI